MREVIMGTMFFMCPTTGHRVSTGVEMDPDCFSALPKHIVKVRCPHCSQPHKLSELVAWLAWGDELAKGVHGAAAA